MNIKFNQQTKLINMKQLQIMYYANEFSKLIVASALQLHLECNLIIFRTHYKHKNLLTVKSMLELNDSHFPMSVVIEEINHCRQKIITEIQRLSPFHILSYP